MKIKRIAVPGVALAVYSAWEPASMDGPYRVITHEDGRWWGRVDTRWGAADARQRAIEAILEAHPGLRDLISRGLAAVEGGEVWVYKDRLGIQDWICGDVPSPDGRTRWILWAKRDFDNPFDGATINVDLGVPQDDEDLHDRVAAAIEHHGFRHDWDAVPVITD